MVIGGYLVVIGGIWWVSVFFSVYRCLLVVIVCYHCLLVVISGYLVGIGGIWWLLVVLCGYLCLLVIIGGYGCCFWRTKV